MREGVERDALGGGEGPAASAFAGEAVGDALIAAAAETPDAGEVVGREALADDVVEREETGRAGEGVEAEVAGGGAPWVGWRERRWRGSRRG